MNESGKKKPRVFAYFRVATKEQLNTNTAPNEYTPDEYMKQVQEERWKIVNSTKYFNGDPLTREEAIRRLTIKKEKLNPKKAEE